jgi:hypothetical protein
VHVVSYEGNRGLDRCGSEAVDEAGFTRQFEEEMCIKRRARVQGDLVRYQTHTWHSIVSPSAPSGRSTDQYLYLSTNTVAYSVKVVVFGPYMRCVKTAESSYGQGGQASRGRTAPWPIRRRGTLRSRVSESISTSRYAGAARRHCRATLTMQRRRFGRNR